MVSSASFGLSGNISAPAWTTSGIRYQNVAATLTDTTSSGTVALAYTDVWGGNTVAASAAATFTNYYGSFFKNPIAGTNVTLTNRYALGADSINTTTLAIGGTVTGPDGGTWTSAGINLSAGSVGAPSLTFGGDTTTGWFRPAANQLEVSISGVKKFDYGVTNSGAWTFSAAVNFAGNVGSNVLNTGNPFSVGLSGSNPQLQFNFNGVKTISTSNIGMFAFGGTTSSFPGLKQSGTNLLVRLADDSGDANISANLLQPHGFTVSTLPASPTTGSIAYVTDAVACTFLATLTGGGTTYCPVTYNGTAWVGG
jgi:hypothetical protein